MSILNKRNALFGWAVWETGKRVMSAKAKGTVRSSGRRAGRVAATVAGVGALVGGAWLARRLTCGDDSPGE
jgi:hypothetical protein